MKNMNSTSNKFKEPIILNRNQTWHKNKVLSFKSIIALVFFVVILFLLVGYYAYSIPTTTIVIDVNTSINLKINRLGAIVSASSIDSDGNTLINETNLKYKNVDNALILILNKAEAKNFIKSYTSNKDQTITLYISGKSINIPKFCSEAKTKKYEITINENGSVKFNNLISDPNH